VSTAAVPLNPVTERGQTARGRRGSHARSIRSGEGVERSSRRGDVGSLLKLVEGKWGASRFGIGAPHGGRSKGSGSNDKGGVAGGLCRMLV
jgi:hypothetical protein